MLAPLDSTAPLLTPVIVASLDGTAVAAISLSDGRTTADPFVLTDGVVSVLHMRRAQLRGEQAHRTTPQRLLDVLRRTPRAATGRA